MRNLAYVPVPERLGDPSLSINLPKLESRPCHAERKKTSERLNKLLWRLNPQPNIIERFRQEQVNEINVEARWGLRREMGQRSMCFIF